MRNLVAATAAAMALADPSALTANVGFIPSFASLLGIVYLGPPLRHLLRYDRPSSGHGFLGWKESAVTTLSAQFAVMPILIRAFGRFSLTAVLANLLILPTVPLAMLLGAALAPLGFVSFYLAFFAAQLAGLLLGYQLFVVRLCAALAVPVPFSFNSVYFFICYYLALALFIFAHHPEP